MGEGEAGGRWAKCGTWRCDICEAEVEDADAAKITKQASRHDIEAWCRAADGLVLGQLPNGEDER